MLGGNSSNPLAPAFMNENRIRYHTNASNHLQLFGNLPAGCGVDPVNYFGNEQTPLLFTSKQTRETEDFSQPQKLQISLNYNLSQDEVDRSASIVNPNPVSTGLRLSYDEDEHNSSETSANGSVAAARSTLLSLGDNMRNVLDRQKEEFDRYIRIQEEQLCRGIRDMNQRHVATFIAAIEKDLSKKVQGKDLEIETMNRKNKELVERINQVAMEVQEWQYRAQYNDSFVNILKTKLQQARSQGAIQTKEGFGDSEVDNTASYVDPNSLHIPAGSSRPTSRCHQGPKQHLRCRACKTKEVSILLMPCRHLCLCTDCNMVINVCPICQLVKTASVQVFLS